MFPNDNSLPARKERHKQFGSTSPPPVDPSLTKESLPDLQRTEHNFYFPIQAVGINNVLFPITIESSIEPFIQATTGTFSITTNLEQHQKGIHMSRLTESLHDYYRQHPVTFTSLKNYTIQIGKKMKQTSVSICVAYPWFYYKKAPVTGIEGTAHAHVQQHVHCKNGEFIYSIHLTGSVASLCPCSKAISHYSAHNQRSHIQIHVQIHEQHIDRDWKELLLKAVEDNASTTLYPVLKRPDEKKVTEQAYENPRFVEDLVRLIACDLYEIRAVDAFTVTATNEESIHQHDATATISYTKQ